MEEFDDIIEQIRRQETMNPPESLTDNVMGRLPQRNPGILTAASFVHQLYVQALESVVSQDECITCRECSFYFFITGLFYLIIGIILMTQMPLMTDSGTVLMKWLKLQPYFTTGAGIWLLALGSLLIIDKSIGTRIARYGTLLYIFFVIVNNALPWPYLRIPYAGFFIIGFAATSALMGIMLIGAVQKTESETL